MTKVSSHLSHTNVEREIVSFKIQKKQVFYSSNLYVNNNFPVETGSFFYDDFNQKRGITQKRTSISFLVGLGGISNVWKETERLFP